MTRLHNVIRNIGALVAMWVGAAFFFGGLALIYETAGPSDYFSTFEAVFWLAVMIGYVALWGLALYRAASAYEEYAKWRAQRDD